MASEVGLSAWVNTPPLSETHWLILESTEVARTLWALPDVINIQAWADSAGVRVEFRNLVGDGEYIRHRHPLILLRGNRRPERTNFTFAHELGHHFISEVRKNPNVRAAVSPRARREFAFIEPGSAHEENFCDAFAPALIVGADRIRGILEVTGLNATAVLAIAAHYGLSLSATVRRLDALGHPCGFILAAPKKGSLHVVRSSNPQVPAGSQAYPTRGETWWNVEERRDLSLTQWLTPNGRVRRVQSSFVRTSTGRIGILTHQEPSSGHRSSYTEAP